MSDIIFVNPPYEQIAAGNDHLKHIINRSPSLGLLLLAAQARKNGYMPKIIESDLENLSPQAVAEIVLKLQPKFVAITLFSVGVFNASVLAKLIKEHSPEITILVGGPHISSMGYETMQKFSQFDIAVVYEGELILEKLLACIDARADLGTVEGLQLSKTLTAYRCPRGIYCPTFQMPICPQFMTTQERPSPPTPPLAAVLLSVPFATPQLLVQRYDTTLPKKCMKS